MESFDFLKLFITVNCCIILLYLLKFSLAIREGCFQFIVLLRQSIELGIPLPQAIEQCASNISFKPLKEFLTKRVLPELRAGKSLAEALKKKFMFFPIFSFLILLILSSGIFFLFLPFFRRQPFSKYDIKVIFAGESNGLLPEGLQILEHKYKETSKYILSRRTGDPLSLSHYISYFFNTLIGFVSIGGFISVYILPTFVSLLEALKIPLPIMTQYLIAISKSLPEFSSLAVISILGIVVIWQIPYIRDPLLIRLPFIKSLFIFSECKLFAKGMSICMEKNVAMDKALQFSEAISMNIVIKKLINSVKEETAKGVALSDALKSQKGFPHFFSWMVSFGEKSHHLPAVMNEMAGYYSMEIPFLIRKIQSQFIVALALFSWLITMFVVLGMFLPLLEFIKFMEGLF